MPFSIAVYEPLQGRDDAALQTGPLRATMELDEHDLDAWAGYSLDWFGVMIGPGSPPGVFEGPTWTVNWLDQELAPSGVRAVRQQARYRSSPLVAEQLWPPGDRERCRVDVLEPDATYSRAAIGRAFRGLALLRGHSLLPRLERARVGRTRIEHSPERMAVVERAIEAWKREPHLTYDQLAERVGLYDRVPPLEDPGRALAEWIRRASERPPQDG